MDEANENSIIEIRIMHLLVYNYLSSFNEIKDLDVQSLLEIREMIKVVIETGIIRNHSFIIKMIKNLVFEGESSPIRINELVDRVPWKWDQFREQLTILEENGFIVLTRDKERNLVCELNIHKKNNQKELALLLDYYTNYYKKKNFTAEKIEEIIDLTRSIILRSLELKRVKETFEMIKLHKISEKELGNLVDKISKEYHTETSEFETLIFRITKLLQENPLYVKGLTRRKVENGY